MSVPTRPAPRFRRVLLTNDDGIAAPGLSLLARLAARHAEEVWVVAPERDQSGMSRAATLNTPLRIEQRAERHFAVGGTPSDCVIMALRHLMRDTPPDLVLSGINRGANLADEVPYSGTVGAAMTARMLGVPAMALSQAFRTRDAVRWDTVETLFDQVMVPLWNGEAPDHWAGFAGSRSDLADSVANINFPDLPAADVLGVRLTRQGRGNVRDIKVEARRDLRGGDYHWLSFQRDPEWERLEAAGEIGGHATLTDVAAVSGGYVSLTPIGFDLTRQKG